MFTLLTAILCFFAGVVIVDPHLPSQVEQVRLRTCKLLKQHDPVSKLVKSEKEQPKSMRN